MILVTGASGLLGSHLLVQLCSAKEKVRAIYRREESLKEVKKVFSYYLENPKEAFDSIEWFKADMLDIPQLEEAFKGVNKVYHIAAMVAFEPEKEKMMLKTNIEGTANIVNICLSSNVEKLCHVSSIASLGNPLEKKFIDENDLWNPDQYNSAYSISKNGSEMEVWRGIEEGLNAVIVNPSIIIGPGFWENSSGQFFNRIYNGLKFKTSGGSGFVSAGDVARAMIILMDSEIHSERFIINAENLSYSDFFDKIATELKVKAPSVKVSPLVLNIARRLDALSHFLFSTSRKITKDTAVSAFNRKFFSSGKLLSAVEFTYETIDDCISFSAEKFLKSKVK